MRARYIIAGLIGAIVIGNAPAVIAEASAEPVVGCEHREAGHVGRHGGQLEDDRFHRSHGERVTCSDDGDGKADSSRDGSEDPTRKHDERHGDDKTEHRDDDKHGDRCIGRCNRDHSLWH